jgi:hypothetical protein
MIELGDYNNEDLSVDLVLLMQLKDNHSRWREVQNWKHS